MTDDEIQRLERRVRAQALLLDALDLLDGNRDPAAGYVSMALEITGLAAPAPGE